MRTFLLLLFPVVVLGSIALRTYWIVNGDPLWSSIGMEAVQLGIFTAAWLAALGATAENP